ncbi:MAG: methyltransferase domain-containing protein [Alphaproteobacteria bacterium]|nr:methyltransferase domain-containing protein [Alphaproteobacteria bacterium]
MKPLVHALLSALRIDARKRSKDYYRAFSTLFEAVGDGSGMFNLGLWDVPDRGLAAAQAALVDRVIEGFDPTGHWLDVGCGPGGVAALLAQRFPELRLTGVNVDPAQVAEATQRCVGFGDRARFVVGDGDALPFVYDRFDAVFSIDSAFQFRDRAQFAHQAWLVLAPGGQFAATDVVWRGQTFGWRNRLRGGLARLALGASEMQTPSDWRRIFERLSFEDVELIDLTEDAWAGLPRWAAQLRQDGPAAGVPAPLIRSTANALERLHEEGADADLGYVLLRGRKPA